MSRLLDTKRNERTLGHDSGFYIKVGPEEYCRLAVSVRNLVRCDDKTAGMRGLKDLETGECFLIEEADLFEYSVTQACDGLASCAP